MKCKIVKSEIQVYNFEFSFKLCLGWASHFFFRTRYEDCHLKVARHDEIQRGGLFSRGFVPVLTLLSGGKFSVFLS